MVAFNKTFFVIVIVMLFGIILNLIPLNEILASYRPPIVLLFLIYWSLAYPNPTNLTYAFIVGLIMDILLITPLGYHSLCFTITVYLILLYYPQIRLQSNANKMLSLLVILIPYFLTSTIGNKILGINFNIIEIIVSILVSVIIWPVLFNMLRFIRQKYTS